MPLWPGETFGRYQLAELLGRGAMGSVYRAYDTVLHRSVALKVLLAPPSATDQPPPSTRGRARILREARAAAGLTHPNAVSIYDIGEVDGISFLAMELVAGQTIRGLIGKDVPLSTRIRWLADVARALGAAHRLGVVHRDIKPENIMVRDDGFVKVLDFGIARRAVERGGEEREAAPVDPTDLDALARLAVTNGTLTREGSVVGTPMYMAPEQMRGEATDGRADQFAWGVLAYEVLTGRLPWDGSGVMMLSQLLSKEVGPLTDAFPEIPARVDAAVRKALNKVPSDRFRSLEEVAGELEAFASSTAAASARPDRMTTLTSSFHLVAWEDVFVLVDYGQARPVDYVTLGELVVAEAAKHPAGMGGLIIVPRNAKPPSEDARAAMRDLMGRLGSSLRCACWLVEGAGFQGAMVRAVLTGVMLVGRLPYESHVASDIAGALEWIVERLDCTAARAAQIPEGVRWIEEQRRRSEMERPPPGR